MRAAGAMVCVLMFVSGIKPVCAQSNILDSLVSVSNLQYLVQTLAADSMKGRMTGSEEANKAARFIADEFRKAGVLPAQGDQYLIAFQPLVKGNIGTGYNVLGYLPGRSKSREMILFSAHYDHIGTRSDNRLEALVTGRLERNDTIFNGANDNASGIAGLISLARYFGQLKDNERTIVFIAFSGEELGLKGSQKMALQLKADSIKAMINMDMIGRRAFRRDDRPYITGNGLSDLRDILNRQLAGNRTFGNQYFQKDPFPNQKLFARSDNVWFAKRGVPAHTVIASAPNDIFYHSSLDEAQHIDYPLLAKVIKAIALGSAGLVDGSATPSRIDPDRVETLEFRH